MKKNLEPDWKNDAIPADWPILLDLHSHVLPQMDDGSSSPEESLSMLREAAKQGVRAMAATSHFYPTKEFPEHFLKRREEAVQALRKAYRGEECPKILPGAEVAYYPGIGRSRELKTLCLQGTHYVLVEMPFYPFGNEVLSDICRVRSNLGLTPILAHIERYKPYLPRYAYDMFEEEGVLLQSNAEAFMQPKERQTAEKMLKQGRIHFLGSDAHNMGSRPPIFARGIGRVAQDLGMEAVFMLSSLSERILKEAEFLPFT